MKILIRFGDLMLKGKNVRKFVRVLNSHIKSKLEKENVKTIFKHDRTYLEFEDSKYELVTKKIMEIPGIHSYSVVYETTKNVEDIIDLAVNVLNKEIDDKSYTFKIETRRSDKKFPHTSNDFSKLVAGKILNKANKNLIVDVKNPEITLTINIREEGAYIFLKSIEALGGYPATIAGKGLLMLSGGIDSPVAAFLGIKQGINVELIHFESTPLTPLESINKVIELSKKIAVYLPNETIKLHIVPFMKTHEALLNNVSESYVITIMRRMMYRIAERFANNEQINVLLNGESVGQVASQTLSSLKVVEDVTRIPIIRPLITYDKKDIIKISEHIDTYKISILPFNDCCSIYVPINPVITPTIKKTTFEESRFDFEPLIVEAVNNIKTLIINKDDSIDLSLYGFTFMEAYENMENERK